MTKQCPALKAQIEALRGEFLPQPFHPTGDYRNKKRVQLHTRAFLVLCHAEVESFLEDWARDIALAAKSVWVKSKRVAPPLPFLVSMMGDRLKEANALAAANSNDAHMRFEKIVEEAFTKYLTRVNDNNGVKEPNVLQLFDPLGVPSTAFTATMLPNLNQLGGDRGVHAHHSGRSKKAVENHLDPLDQYTRMTNVLTDLEVFESWLIEYRRRIR